MCPQLGHFTRFPASSSLAFNFFLQPGHGKLINIAALLLAGERVNHEGGVDTASAGRFGGREDVGAVLKHQPVRGDIAIDGGIDGQGEDQNTIVSTMLR